MANYNIYHPYCKAPLLCDYSLHLWKSAKKIFKAFQLWKFCKYSNFSGIKVLKKFRQSFGKNLGFGQITEPLINKLVRYSAEPRFGQSHQKKFRPNRIFGRILKLRFGRIRRFGAPLVGCNLHKLFLEREWYFLIGIPMGHSG